MWTLFEPWSCFFMTWFFAASGDGEPAAAPASDGVSTESSGAAGISGTRVIEFYVPATFQLPERRWIPEEARGKVIEFPARGVRKSA